MGEFIEKYKIAIGIFLLVLTLASGGYLLYRENYLKPDLARRLESAEQEISQLKNSNQSVANIQNVQAGDLATASQVTVTADKSADEAPVKSTAKTTTPTVAKTPVATAPPPVAAKVNINTGTAAELDTLKGIGPVLAQRIIDYRTKNGAYQTLLDIKKVAGIGDKTYEKFKDNITL